MPRAALHEPPRAGRQVVAPPPASRRRWCRDRRRRGRRPCPRGSARDRRSPTAWRARSVSMRTACSSVKRLLARAPSGSSRCVWSEESMSCETWAPESEKVTTVRGCLHQLERVVLVLVGDRLEEEEVEVLLEREVDHRLDRMLRRARARPRPPSGAGPPRCRRRRSSRSRRPRLGAERRWRPSRSPRGLDQPAAQLGIAQPLLLLGERQRAQLLPHRQAVERQLGLEREQRGERRGCAPGRTCARPRRRSRRAGRGTCARRRARRARLKRPKVIGPARLDGEVAQPRVVVAQAGIARRRGPRPRRRARRCRRSARP